ncbi:phosphodiester glycosidase family protein [Actinophytocola sp. NPDC049390]|uniref:phosphodiester glycosidase family protein n=1 Tax=Actinophytocola sp. NPDC049390 TaxID=3363894 RepID=UPI003799F511
MPRTHFEHTRVVHRRGMVAALAAALAVILAGWLTPPTPSAQATPGESWHPRQLDSWSTITQRTTTPPEPVTNGVTYSSESIASIDGNVPIHVVTADTRNANVRLGTIVSHDVVVDPENETVSSMANRTGAVAGINGGYFDFNASGQANDGEIVDGEIWKSPTGDHEGTVSVLRDGSVVYGKQEFSGTVAVTNGPSRALTSVNRLDDATGDGITLVTPRLGDVPTTWFGGTHVMALGRSDDGGETITITSVTSADSISGAHFGLVGGDAGSPGGRWIQENVEAGTVLTTTRRTSPNDDIRQLIQGPGRILKDGAVFSDPNHQMPSGLHPESVIGSTADGELVMAVFDGQKTADVALGVGWRQAASYLRSLGATDAVLLDGGGSTDMVVRRPGDTAATVVNTPSDLAERPVANGLFVYSTATAPGPATGVSINGGTSLSTAAGVVSQVDAYSTDAAGNPSTDEVAVEVSPSGLGTWADGRFTAGSPGSGALIARSGRAVETTRVTVSEAFDELSISPARKGLPNGGTQQFTVHGTNRKGAAVTVEPDSVDWRLDNTDVGAIDPATGVFTAAGTGDGAVTISASAGGRTATATVSVGSVIRPLVTADSAADWRLRAEGGATTVPADRLAETTDVPPWSDQERALRVDYTFPDDPGQHRVRLSPGNGAGVQVDLNDLGQKPQDAYFSFKIDSPTPQQSWIVLNVADADGHTLGLWTALQASDYGKWREMSKSINRGVFTSYPLTIQDISFVGQFATAADAGTFTFAGMRVSYDVGNPTQETPYEPINANNPSWLSYVQDASEFKPGGQTFVLGDDGHLRAEFPDSASATNVDDMVRRTKGEAYRTASGQTVEPLPEVARPEVAVSLGDISDTGRPEDLTFAKNVWEQFDVPLWDVVGNHEISQGAYPQNENFHDVFNQDTHFSFTRGSATFIGLDNSSGSIVGSDPFQVPAQAQYPWFVRQLDQADTPVVFVGLHWPAYDHAPSKTNQFSSRWEAQQFLQIIQNYRLAHPNKHVVVMYGHSRGFANQLTDPRGNPGDATTGIPQFTIADIGTQPYVAADKGGFFHFALFHVNNDGTVQYTVEPMLQSMTIDQGTAGDDAAAPRGDTLVAGETKQFTATAVNTGGSDIADPPTMPVADPLSHVWASSDERVARIDPVTGSVTAIAAGTTTISVTTGGITSRLELTVTAR